VYSSIVVGTDGSPTAEVAVNHAIGLAVLCGAPLTVTLAHEPDDDPEEDTGARVAAILTSAHQQAASFGVTVRTEARVGKPVEAILAAAAANGADLVVVGNKGMRGARRILGSVGNDLTHRAPCTVLLVYTG